VLTHRPGPGRDTADALIRTTRTALLALLTEAARRELETAGELAVEDDTDALGQLIGGPP
jgi:hypothetical protein